MEWLIIWAGADCLSTVIAPWQVEICLDTYRSVEWSEVAHGRVWPEQQVCLLGSPYASEIKGVFWLTGSLITSSLSGQTASTVGRLLYYSHSGCFSLRENNNDEDCRLLTAFSNPPPHMHTPPFPSLFSPRWKRQVIPALWARVTPEKKNKGITGRISCSGSWQVFPSFLSRPCVNCRDSLL